MSNNERITASEAVYGFAAWLSCRTEGILHGEDDAARMANLVKEWIKENNLPDPREGVYPHNLTQPIN